MGLVDLLYPPRCLGCDLVAEGEGLLCGACMAGLVAAPEPGCGACAAVVETGELRCRRCRELPPPFEAVVVGHAFAGPLAEAIPRWKYRGRPEHGGGLIELAEPTWRRGLAVRGPFDLAIPIPLGEVRLAERGFNQAVRLADGLARLGGPRVETERLLRRDEAGSQVGTGAAGRAERMAEAFRVVDPAGQLRGASIALVDDVVTTGSTLRAAALQLKGAGAARVVAFALARAI